MSKKFAIVGVGGYVAPRHLKAIKETGNELVAALDVNDSVGILDSYFPDVKFFRDDIDFKLYLMKEKVDYVSICSPNHYHLNHIVDALSHKANVICEKPLVLNQDELDSLESIEKTTGKRIYTILQLRCHPDIINLEDEYANTTEVHKVNLQYITPRGDWYFKSWKGDIRKSGGLATNIGIHFFDMLIWIFGDVKIFEVTEVSDKTIGGELLLDKAHVKWILSIDRELLPINCDSTYRMLNIDGREVEFSTGFADLHTKVYKEILDGMGYGIIDVRPSIKLVGDINEKLLRDA